MSRTLVLVPTGDSKTTTAAYRQFEVADIAKTHTGPRIVRSVLYAAGAAGALIAAASGATIFLTKALMAAAERDTSAAAVDGSGAIPDGQNRLGVEVAAYRTGYADGFVDCVTVRSGTVYPKAYSLRVPLPVPYDSSGPVR